MTHRFILTVSLLVVGSVPAFAQHPAQHPQGPPHDRSSHPPMDPQQHALMHGLVLGTWTGMVTSPDGSSTKLGVAVMNGKHGELTLKAASPLKDIGSASDVVLDGHTLRWTQGLSGMSCKAFATVTEAATQAAAMKGTMACPERELAFALTKTKN
jgi:hypothetical protein